MNSLRAQYEVGPNGDREQPGDHGLITEMVRTRNLRHVNDFKNCYTLFTDDEDYGKSYQFPPTSSGQELPGPLKIGLSRGFVLPQSIGDLILERQMTLIQSMLIMIDDILEADSSARDKRAPTRRPPKGATEALSKLSIRQLEMKTSKKPTLLDLAASARDQESSLEEYIALLSEPAVLEHAINFWFFSRPELVPDEKGRMLPAHTDKYISSSFFDTVHASVKTAAIWSYVRRLVELLENTPVKDKAYRAIILQELSNVCHLEYGRAQALFKRHVQTGFGRTKYFRRVSNACDDAGNARVSMKVKPDDIFATDPQLSYMLRLCHPDTNASKAVDWAQKLSDLHDAHAEEREKLVDRELDAFGDLAIIICFIRDLSALVSLPAMSRKKGQTFILRSHELEKELNQLKNGIDLRDFAVPIKNLLEPGVAEAALKTMDQYIVDKTGAELGFLHQDLVDDCFADLERRRQEATAKAQETAAAPSTTVSIPELPEERVEQRRQKSKTRPSHSSVYEIARPTEGTSAAAGSEVSPRQTLKVRKSTADVFSTLFDKSKSRGTVSWEAFEAAMADLGFSIFPKMGSVYTFCPPESMDTKKSFTIHRPHQSRIEGYMILIVARRLRRVFGWGENTFEVA